MIHEATISGPINEAEDFSIKRMLGTAALTAALGAGGILGYKDSKKLATNETPNIQASSVAIKDPPPVQVRPSERPKAVAQPTRLSPKSIAKAPLTAAPTPAKATATPTAAPKAAAPAPAAAKAPVAKPAAPAETAALAKLKGWEDLSKFATRQGFTVTSTTSGKHNVGSKHGKGLAIDVRTRDKTSKQVAEFIQQARNAGIWVKDERTRPPGQKVWSGPHLHLEIR